MTRHTRGSEKRETVRLDKTGGHFYHFAKTLSRYVAVWTMCTYQGRAKMESSNKMLAAAHFSSFNVLHFHLANEFLLSTYKYYICFVNFFKWYIFGEILFTYIQFHDKNLLNSKSSSFPTIALQLQMKFVNVVWMVDP